MKFRFDPIGGKFTGSTGGLPLATLYHAEKKQIAAERAKRRQARRDLKRAKRASSRKG